MKWIDEEKTTDNPSVYKKVTRRWLNCPVCPPNKGENAKGKKNPRSDKYKSVRKGRA